VDGTIAYLGTSKDILKRWDGRLEPSTEKKQTEQRPFFDGSSARCL